MKTPKGSKAGRAAEADGACCSASGLATISRAFSRSRHTFPDIPPHNRTALSTIASKTGCTSLGELAMTRKISLVAACCARPSISERRSA
jgi:hypothetical protein